MVGRTGLHAGQYVEVIGGWEQDGIAFSLLSGYLVLPSRPYKSISARFACFIR